MIVEIHFIKLLT